MRHVLILALLHSGAAFGEGKLASLPLSFTVARGELPVAQPVITRALLKRGQERFGIYCAVCHGADGYGQGMAVQRGFPAPPSYHSEELRKKPLSHFVDVITNGYGAMYSYAERVSANDRWAIAAYIRALQLSQNAQLDDLPPIDRSQFHD